MRLRRVSALAVGPQTAFAYDDGLQGQVMLVGYGHDNGARFMHLLVKDVLACDRAAVAAAGLDPDETHGRFLQKVKGSEHPLSWKIDVYLYGEWSFAQIVSGDVCMFRGQGIAVRPSRLCQIGGDHQYELVIVEGALAEIDRIEYIPPRSAKEQPHFEPRAKTISFDRGQLFYKPCSNDAPVPARATVVANDNCTPLGHLDRGTASVMGVIVGQTFPSQTRNVDCKSVLFIVDETRGPNSPMILNCFRLPAQEFPLGRMGEVIRLDLVEAILHRGEVQLEVKKTSTWTVFSREGNAYGGDFATKPFSPARLMQLLAFSRQHVMDDLGPFPNVVWPMQKCFSRLADRTQGSVDLCVRIVDAKLSTSGGWILLVSETSAGTVAHGIIHVVGKTPTYASRLQALGVMTPGACFMIRAVTAKPSMSHEARALQLELEYFASSGEHSGTVATSFMAISALRSPVAFLPSASAAASAAPPPLVLCNTSRGIAPSIVALWDCPPSPVVPTDVAQDLALDSSAILCGRVAWCFPVNPQSLLFLPNKSTCFVFALEDAKGRVLIAACDEVCHSLFEQLKKTTSKSSVGDAWDFVANGNNVWLRAQVTRLNTGFVLNGGTSC